MGLRRGTVCDSVCFLSGTVGSVELLSICISLSVGVFRVLRHGPPTVAPLEARSPDTGSRRQLFTTLDGQNFGLINCRVSGRANERSAGYGREGQRWRESSVLADRLAAVRLPARMQGQPSPIRSRSARLLAAQRNGMHRHAEWRVHGDDLESAPRAERRDRACGSLSTCTARFTLNSHLFTR